MNMPSILLVEDDKNLGFVIEDNLSSKGFRVTRCLDGEEGLAVFRANCFDLCILDVMLPRKDGFSLAREIRSINRDIPILLLTAKNMTEDKLEGFSTGADDYIVKPFSMQELFCRCEVFLKRKHASAPESIASLGFYRFDYANLILYNDKTQFKLTFKEAEVLHLLYLNRNRVIKREEILKAVWGDDDYFMGRSMDVFISKLRKYLKDDPSIQIVNHHGIGFRLEIT